jgi:hypothetical protein
VLHWPAPEVVRSSIPRATGGALSEPRELFARVHEATARGELASLSGEEMELIARNFHEEGGIRAIRRRWPGWGRGGRFQGIWRR